MPLLKLSVCLATLLAIVGVYAQREDVKSVPVGDARAKRVETIYTELLSQLRTHSLNQVRQYFWGPWCIGASLTQYLQPYLDSDMQSRWFDFGADTVIRADQ